MVKKWHETMQCLPSVHHLRDLHESLHKALWDSTWRRTDQRCTEVKS